MKKSFFGVAGKLEEVGEREDCTGHQYHRHHMLQYINLIGEKLRGSPPLYAECIQGSILDNSKQGMGKANPRTMLPVCLYWPSWPKGDSKCLLHMLIWYATK